MNVKKILKNAESILKTAKSINDIGAKSANCSSTNSDHINIRPPCGVGKPSMSIAILDINGVDMHLFIDFLKI